MPAELHFLNVKQGDCSWIKHPNGNNTIIDVNNAGKMSKDDKLSSLLYEYLIKSQSKSVRGNFNQKKYPVNPIEYLQSFNVSSVFRFILSHPDMDHMGGIEDFFNTFSPNNFWDTDNNKEIESFDGAPYSESDWKFYKKLRAGSESDPKRLVLYHGAKGQYFNRDKNNNPGGNGIYLLAPTKELVEAANESGDYNDCSYVILYRSPNNARTIIAGDSHDKTWEHILKNYQDDVKDIDLLIAPHHGRASGRSYDFLDTLKTKINIFRQC